MLSKMVMSCISGSMYNPISPIYPGNILEAYGKF